MLKIYSEISDILVPLILISLLGLTGCATNQPEPRKVVLTQEVVHAVPAPLPEGVVQYCWEEPMVVQEKIQPGLGNRGDWYYSGHTAIRQVREGKWRPCKRESGRLKK